MAADRASPASAGMLPDWPRYYDRKRLPTALGLKTPTPALGGDLVNNVLINNT